MDKLTIREKLRLINAFGHQVFSFREGYYTVRISPPILVFALVMVHFHRHKAVLLFAGVILLITIVIWQYQGYNAAKNMIKYRSSYYKKHYSLAKKMFYKMMFIEYGTIILLALFTCFNWGE